jgi:hypothetical protein
LISLLTPDLPSNTNKEAQCEQIMIDIAFVLGSFILPKYTMKSFTECRKRLPIKFNKFQFSSQTKNFFNLLGDKSVEEKKDSVLEIYKLIFRFSIEKLLKILDNDAFLIIILSYIKDSRMERFHQRPVLQKNLGAYYRCIENMLNFSP